MPSPSHGACTLGARDTKANRDQHHHRGPGGHHIAAIKEDVQRVSYGKQHQQRQSDDQDNRDIACEPLLAGIAAAHQQHDGPCRGSPVASVE